MSKMKSRSKISKKKSRKIFSTTANLTNVRNLTVPKRGGIRL